MRYLLAIPRTVFGLLLGVASTALLAPIAFVVGSRNPANPFVERLIRLWATTWLKASGTRLHVRGTGHVEKDRSYVVVANHLSNFDVMVCFAGIPLPIRYLAKKELFRIPILAPAMRAVGIVEVDRDSPAQALESINRQAHSVVERGHSLIIYPEGTRSRTGELKPFKKGAFTMAVTAQLPVLPVTIEGTWEVWRPERPLIFGGDVHLVIHPPIETEGMGRRDVDALRDEARRVIEQEFEELRRRGERLASQS